ncbi:MAG: 2-C-methyl-D-erythritol 2,4-cyclodiphosphate synthase [Tissierellia bacterium]|nr:2-C-methyl-D-erythritol 2,4-cyclodiphosphate synthase [Tissierellia bacterium]
MRIGVGYDVHRFSENRPLILGGVKIPFNKGLLGHSDADVLVHAINDAILGALAEGDIGKLFPDNNPKYKNMRSLLMTEEVWSLLDKNGYMIGNIDSVLALQEPKIAPYIEKMRKNIAEALKTDICNVSVKATTTERLGFEGRGEGVSSYAVVIIKRKE